MNKLYVCFDIQCFSCQKELEGIEISQFSKVYTKEV